MKSISPGDVYLTTPALKTESGKETKMTKDISCWMGTVSQRPVVILREPKAWDRFNTVTVVAGFSNDGPSISCNVEGIYGVELNKYKYEWYPHMVFTIPVNRLCRFLGRLTNRELNDLLYASNWINNVNMQENPEKYPVPPVYETAEMYVDEYENAKYDSPNGIIVSDNLKMVDKNLPEEYQGQYFELDSNDIPRRFRPEYNGYHRRIKVDKNRYLLKEEEQPKEDIKKELPVTLEPSVSSSNVVTTTPREKKEFVVTEDMVPIPEPDKRLDDLENYSKYTTFDPLTVYNYMQSHKIDYPTNLDTLPKAPPIDMCKNFMNNYICSFSPNVRKSIIHVHEKLTPFDYYILTHAGTHAIAKIFGVQMTDASLIRQCYADIDLTYRSIHTMFERKETQE